tara:strand:- start:2534 stop:2821 length:288 start_codon:yes stop_codon:yes gene_type:complete
MGTLSAPNKIKDVYTKLIFKGDDGNLYLDNGSADVLVQSLPLQGVSTGTSAPTSDVSEGDLHYDSDDDVFYVRDENSWNEVLVAGASTLNGGTFT